MASPAGVINTGMTLGQFLMAEDVNQAGLIAYNVRQLSAHDVTMIRKVIQENWEDEEQMVSNLLQFPHLIPEDIRMESLKRGLIDLECPYYILSAAVGLQRIPIDEQQWGQFLGVLKQACLHDVGMVSMRAFMTLQPKLKHPDDTTFITDILKQPKSSLFQNALTWLIMKVKEKSEIMTTLQDSGITAEAIQKAEKIVDEQLKIQDNGEEQNLSLQFLNYIPNFNDFDAMLDKQEALTEFFMDLDGDKDGKISLEDVQNFLEDIGKKVSLEEIRKNLKSIDVDVNGNIDKDTFIEIMFPRFQMQ